MTRAAAILDRIDAALDCPSGIDFDAYVVLNAEFHELLARLPGSAVILREAERVARLPLASPSSFLQEQALIPDFQASLARAQGHHRAILAAIRAREGTRAEALAREHARLALNNLDYLTKADPRLARKVPGLALLTTD
jgi:GntR family transcriptional regulator of vanillate catabolism